MSEGIQGLGFEVEPIGSKWIAALRALVTALTFCVDCLFVCVTDIMVKTHGTCGPLEL